MAWIFLDPMKQEGFMQPLLGGIDTRNCAKTDLRVEMLGKIEVQAAFEDCFPLDQALVFGL